MAEPADLNTRVGRPESTWLIVRRVKPSGRHTKKLTDFERKTGWRYSITATNIGRMCMRFPLYHLPVRLTKHTRRRWLRIEATWPWANAFTTCWRRRSELPAVT